MQPASLSSETPHTEEHTYQTSNRHWWSVDAAHKKTLQHNFVETGLRPSGKESVELKAVAVAAINAIHVLRGSPNTILHQQISRISKINTYLDEQSDVNIIALGRLADNHPLVLKPNIDTLSEIKLQRQSSSRNSSSWLKCSPTHFLPSFPIASNTRKNEQRIASRFCACSDRSDRPFLNGEYLFFSQKESVQILTCALLT